MIPRKRRNSSKTNLTFSIIFHGLLLGAVFFFAAREGLVGKKMQALTATLVPKEKKPEPPKEKPVEQKVEAPKQVAAAKPTVAPPKVEAAAPPDSAPAVAPVGVNLPSFQFSEGAHEVQSISDPFELYKSLIEYAFRSNWQRPDGLDDDNFKVQVELMVDAKGRVVSHRWLNGSGNALWDESVKSAVSATKAISQPPPKGFPEKFIVRFDVATMAQENSLSLQ